MTTHTTLGYWSSTDLQSSISGHLRRQAERAEAALGREAHSQVHALEALRGHIESVSTDDPRMWALHQMEGTTGDSDVFAPGRLQEELLARLGDKWEGSTPPVDVTFNELVGAGVGDLIKALNERSGQSQHERDVALGEAREAVETATRADRLASELDEARNRMEEVSAERDELRGTVDYFRLRFGENGSDGPAPSATKPRRTKVDGHTGVYSKELSDGTVYEIGFKDSSGKQRWKAIGPDLDQAVAIRAEKVAEAEAEREAVPA